MASFFWPDLTEGGGGGGSPGGPSESIQFNNSGTLGGSAFLTFNGQETTFDTTYNIITTAPTNPSIAAAGSDASYPDGTVIHYRIYSYTTFNSAINVNYYSLSTIFLDCGSFTISGGGGGVDVSYTPDTNPDVTGYFLAKSVDGGPWTGAPNGTNNPLHDEISQNIDSIPTSGYTTDVIVPHRSGDTIYALYAPNEYILAGGLILPSPLAVSQGGTGHGDGTLWGLGGQPTLDWYNQHLISNSSVVYDWSQALIYDANVPMTGNALSIDAGNRGLYADQAHGSSLSISYAGRFLHDISGIDVLFWQGGVLVYPANDSAAGLVVAGFSATQSGDLLVVRDKKISPTVSYLKVTNIGKLGTTAGSSAATLAKVGGVIIDHFADAGSTSTTETDLYSDSIAANTLSTNGDKLVGTYGVALVNSTSTKRTRIYFGGTAIFDSGALTVTAASEIIIRVLIIRDSSTSIRYSISASTTAASTGAFATVGKLTGLTLSSANILKITGQAGGAGVANNDVQAQNAYVEYKPSF